MKIFDQINLVMQNDLLTLVKKDKLIKDLRRLIIKFDQNNLSINSEILDEVKNARQKISPDLFELVELEVISSGKNFL